MLKKIRSDELQVGMHVVNMDRSWTKHPFLTKRKRITSHRQIQELKEYGIFEVTVDLSEHEESSRDHSEENFSFPPTIIEALDNEKSCSVSKQENEQGTEVPFENELEAATVIRKEAHAVIRSYLDDIRMGKSVEIKRIKQVVDQMIQSVFRNPDALVSLTRIKGYDEYTFVHSIDVCILTITLGRYLQLSMEELLQIGIGGLLHDTGKMRIPASILNKPGKVTEEEFVEIKKHPLYTLEYLEKAGEIPTSSKVVGLQHHERCNARGYPYGLAEAEISLFGQIAAIADVYDAVTSDRCYKRALPPWEAVRRMYAWAQKGDFNLTLTERFIQCIGVYPVGSVVQLETGEVGIVHSLDHDKLLLPRVLLIHKDLTNPYPRPFLVDLTEDSGKSNFKRSVARPLAPAQINIDVNHYLFGLSPQ